MTSMPDQFPAATEVGKVPATDPVDKASEVESEQDPGQHDAVGTSDPGDGAEKSGPVDAAGDAEEPTDGIIESVPSAEAVASADGDEPESAAGEASATEPVEDVPDEPAAEAEPEQDASPAPAAETKEAAPAAEPAAEADLVEAELVDEAEPVDAAPEVATRTPAETVADVPEAAPEAESSRTEETAAEAPAPAPEEPAPPVETASGLPRRPKRDETPTEEISIVPAPARPGPATTPAPGTTAPAEPAAAEPVATESAPEPAAKPGQATTAEANDDVGAEPATAKSAATSTPGAPTPSGSTTPPVVDETFDFKALSFAAIAAAHKKELGPRTVVGEVETTGEPTSGDRKSEEEVAAAKAPAEATAAADTSAPAETAEEAAAETEAPAAAATELFASPTTHTPPAAAPPSPFPTPAAPPQHQPGAPAQAQPTVPQQQPPSPFPASPGGSAHGFPAVHDYAPEASYAGWRPPTPEDESAKRRRFALIGGAVVALIAVVAVVAIIVNLVNRQQWEPIEAMIAEPREVHPLQLVLGSCVESIPDDGEVSEVLAVPCDASHTAQVVGRTDFADAAVWPGRDEVDKRVALVCGTKQLGPVARTSPLADSVRYVVWGPSEDSWDDGDRVGLCLATTAEPITQDLLQ